MTDDWVMDTEARFAVMVESEAIGRVIRKRYKGKHGQHIIRYMIQRFPVRGESLADTNASKWWHDDLRAGKKLVVIERLDNNSTAQPRGTRIVKLADYLNEDNHTSYRNHSYEVESEETTKTLAMVAAAIERSMDVDQTTKFNPQWKDLEPILRDHGVVTTMINPMQRYVLCQQADADGLMGYEDKSAWVDGVIEDHPTWESQEHRRLRHAKAISSEYESNAMGWVNGDEPEVMAEGKYACVVRTESQSFVYGAADLKGIANVVLGTYQSDGDESEWFDGAFDLDTGEPVNVEYKVKIVVNVEMNGKKVKVEG